MVKTIARWGKRTSYPIRGTDAIGCLVGGDKSAYLLTGRGEKDIIK